MILNIRNYICWPPVGSSFYLCIVVRDLTVWIDGIYYRTHQQRVRGANWYLTLQWGKYYVVNLLFIVKVFILTESGDSFSIFPQYKGKRMIYERRRQLYTRLYNFFFFGAITYVHCPYTRMEEISSHGQRFAYCYFWFRVYKGKLAHILDFLLFLTERSNQFILSICCFGIFVDIKLGSLTRP